MKIARLPDASASRRPRETAIGPSDVGRHQQNESLLPARMLGGFSPDFVMQVKDVLGLRWREQLERDRHDRSQPLKRAVATHFQCILRSGVNKILAIDPGAERGEVPGRKHRRQIGVQKNFSMPITPQHGHECAAAASVRCDRIVCHQHSPLRTCADLVSATVSETEYARHNHERRSNIKSFAGNKGGKLFLVATAQVEAWVGARRGSISEAARRIDASFADAALGRMMLHRRAPSRPP